MIENWRERDLLSSASVSFKEESPRNELRIVDPTYYPSSNFKLPRGWTVKKRPSNTITGRVDKYYYDPITGHQFRSLLSVQRYLNGQPEPTTRTRSSRTRQPNMNIVPYTFKCASMVNLPNNWIIEEKPRSNVNYPGIVDRYFIDTETGSKFRSLRAARRYLQEMEEELQAASQSAKKHRTRKDASTSRPEKVKWVLSGPGGNMWKAIIGESMVSESIKQNWFETFVLRIQDKC
ncbi:hypothetical protein ACFE04_006031 [Oxalis oulophora]